MKLARALLSFQEVVHFEMEPGDPPLDDKCVVQIGRDGPEPHQQSELVWLRRRLHVGAEVWLVERGWAMTNARHHKKGTPT